MKQNAVTKSISPLSFLNISIFLYYYFLFYFYVYILDIQKTAFSNFLEFYILSN